MIRSFVFRGSLVLFFGLLSAEKSHACKCFPATFQEEVERSHAIFLGRVVSVTGGTTFNIQVIKLWKGDSATKEIQLRQETSCERATFQLEKEYIFYVVNNSVSNCSRTPDYEYTVDDEWLDEIFQKRGNKLKFLTNHLTERELAVLKNILRRVGAWYPENLDQSNIRFVRDDKEINKAVFFDVWNGFFRIQVYPSKEGADSYFVWTFSDNPKSFRRQQKRFIRKYISRKQIDTTKTQH